MTKRDHCYYVYLVASRSHTLYCGVTNSIERRTDEHRDGTHEGFSSAYHCNRLVRFERYNYVANAIDREKQIKRWRRSKKVMLIKTSNPTWIDLSEAWRVENANPSTLLRYAPDDEEWVRFVE